MIATHGDGHAPDLARQRPAPQQTATVQRLYASALAYAKFPQALPFRRRENGPVNALDIAGLAKGIEMQSQETGLERRADCD